MSDGLQQLAAVAITIAVFAAMAWSWCDPYKGER